MHHHFNSVQLTRSSPMVKGNHKMYQKIKHSPTGHIGCSLYMDSFKVLNAISFMCHNETYHSHDHRNDSANLSEDLYQDFEEMDVNKLVLDDNQSIFNELDGELQEVYKHIVECVPNDLEGCIPEQEAKGAGMMVEGGTAKNTVLIHSIHQSCITGLPKSTKSHNCHSHFGKVTKPFSDSKNLFKT